ncbi:unnamed protein product [Hydatigera taeniaeformis]|uniref:Secreted protein n=1 Tax=Hydatigena taeniaeformis TaxID=6205 RepID=A0A0R3X3P4_HYDTA|nr:unnamed protein product [Hydatigera taeniaeformis]
MLRSCVLMFSLPILAPPSYLDQGKGRGEVDGRTSDSHTSFIVIVFAIPRSPRVPLPSSVHPSLRSHMASLSYIHRHILLYHLYMHTHIHMQAFSSSTDYII